MKSEFFRVNIETGEYTEKVVLDIEDESDTPECVEGAEGKQD